MNFKDLTEGVLKAPIGNGRLTDLKKGKYNLMIDGDDVFLIDVKKSKTPISVNSLAALRVVTDIEKASKVIDTRSARAETETYGNFKTLIQAEGAKLDEKTSFEVVHHLRIIDSISDKPVYKNEHYQGYPEYLKTTRKISADRSQDKDAIAARGVAYTAASETLRATELKAAVTLKDENLMMMPVFVVTN